MRRLLLGALGAAITLGAVACKDSPGHTGRDAATQAPDASAAQPSLIGFSHERGFYDTPFELTVTTEESHDEIRLTLDGSKPGPEHGEVYAGPIPFETTGLIRAVLVKDGLAVSPIITHSYLFREAVFQQGDLRPGGEYVFWTTEMDPVVTTDPTYAPLLDRALMAIPSLSVVTDPEAMFGVAGIHRGNNLMPGSGGTAGDLPNADYVDEIEASIELIYPEGYPRGSFLGFQVNAGIKTQGGGGRWHNGTYDHKQSFGLRFRGSYGVPSLRYPIFEDAPNHSAGESGTYDKLILRAGHNKSWGANYDNDKSAYTRDQLGRDLQLDMSGIGARGTFVHLFLNGIYWGLYNLTERADDAHAARYFGGQEEDWYSGKAKGGTVDGDSARFDTWRNTIAGNGDFDALQEYLAVDEYIDMCLLNVYAATGDFPQYYFANRNTPEPGPLYFFAWDTEDAFDGGSKRSGPPNIDRLTGCYEYFEMWDASAGFRSKVADRAIAATEQGGALSDDEVLARWNALNSYIEDAMILESARWGDERIDDTGTRYTRDEHWKAARDLVTADLEGRAEAFLEELRTSERNGVPYLPAP